MIKSTYICHLRNPDIQKNSTCWFLLSNSLLLKEEIVQRFGFIRQSPIVAAATISQNFKFQDPPFYLFLLNLALEYFVFTEAALKFSFFLLKTWSVSFSVSEDQSTILPILKVQYTIFLMLQKPTFKPTKRTSESLTDTSNLVLFFPCFLFFQA